MRDFLLKAAICLILLAGLAPGRVQAAQKRPVKGTRLSQADAYSLEDVMKSPREYLNREVVFYCRFATTADLFKQINTRFNPNSHVNLAVWPDKTPLWTAEGRKKVLPTLYIAKNQTELLASLRTIRKYELLAVTGEVHNVYAGYPWILVTGIERRETDAERLCEQTIEHMESGFASLDAGSGAAAAMHFERALQFGLPTEYLASARRQIAQAYLLENRLDLARDSLREAVGLDSSDPVLHLALADVCLQMDEPDEALASASLALDLSGKYPQAHGIRGEALSLLGNYAEAFAELNAAAGTPGITPREKAVVSLRRARIYSRSDRPADAARLYAVVSEPGEALSADPNVHNEIGLFYESLFLESGDERYLDSASAAFGEAARIATLNPVFLYNQAEAEFRRQKSGANPDLQKVLGILEKIDRINPDYAPARLLFGRVRYLQGEAEEAERIYQSVAPHLGGDSMALLALAEAYVELGRNEDARAAVRAARDSQPWNRRLQALGRHIENSASGMTQAAPSSAGARRKPAVSKEADANDKYYSEETDGWMDVGAVMRSENGPPAAKESAGSASSSLRPPVARTEAGAGAADLSALAAPSGATLESLPVGVVRLPGEIAPPSAPPALNLDYDTPRLITDEFSGELHGAEREATVDADGFLRFGMVPPVSSASAYASLPAASGADGAAPPKGGEVVRVPPPFTFTPDTSPVLIADVRPQAVAGDRRVVRNANLYRRHEGVRRPAEITEREPLSPPRIGDSAAMAPPAPGSSIPRTRVLLPSSSAGIGAATDSP